MESKNEGRVRKFADKNPEQEAFLKSIKWANANREKACQSIGPVQEREIVFCMISLLEQLGYSITVAPGSSVVNVHVPLIVDGEQHLTVEELELESERRLLPASRPLPTSNPVTLQTEVLRATG